MILKFQKSYRLKGIIIGSFTYSTYYTLAISISIKSQSSDGQALQ